MEPYYEEMFSIIEMDRASHMGKTHVDFYNNITLPRLLNCSYMKLSRWETKEAFIVNSNASSWSNNGNILSVINRTEKCNNGPWKLILYDIKIDSDQEYEYIACVWGTAITKYFRNSSKF